MSLSDLEKLGRGQSPGATPRKSNPPMLRTDGVLTTFRLPKELLSVNKLVGRHWRAKHRESKEWEQAIRLALCDRAGAKAFADVLYVMSLGTRILNHKGEKVWVSRCEEKRHVTITRQVPTSRRFIRDDDNLTASCKPVIDALKRTQLIRDDSRKWLELVVAPQQVSGDEQCWTVVEIRKA